MGIFGDRGKIFLLLICLTSQSRFANWCFFYATVKMWLTLYNYLIWWHGVKITGNFTAKFVAFVNSYGKVVTMLHILCFVTLIFPVLYLSSMRKANLSAGSETGFNLAVTFCCLSSSYLTLLHVHYLLNILFKVCLKCCPNLVLNFNKCWVFLYITISKPVSVISYQYTRCPYSL